jgi:DNA-binding transcriptional MerR regulator
MGVSTHQIRYFEDKEVLLPAYTDTNQYRMYGLEQVYRLAQILLLRKLGFPVQTIKESIDKPSSEQMSQLLHASLDDLEAEIKRLEELRRLTVNILEEQREYAGQSPAYRIKQKNATVLKCWFRTDARRGMDVMLLAKQSPPPDLFESDIYFVIEDNGKIAVCTESKTEGGLMLPESRYLCYPFLAEDEGEIELRIHGMLQYAELQSLALNGPIVLAEKSYLSLFSPDKLHYELMIEVQEKGEAAQTRESV